MDLSIEVSKHKKKTLLFFMLFYIPSSLASTLELEWQHYISAPALKSQLENYVLLKWNQKTDFHIGSFYFDSNFQSEYALDRSKTFYLNVSELYLFYKYQLNKPLYSIQSIELIIGRKIKPWSLADKHWEMDLWNPLNRWNPLHPITNGLIGSFLTLNSKKWSVDFFVGPLHVPNLEAPFTRKNNEIHSSSRWFYPVPNQADIPGGYMDIYYKIQSPFIFNVLQPSYLASFKTWSKNLKTHYWLKLSVASKPVNHLFFVRNKTNLINIGKEKDAKSNIGQTITFLPVRQRLISLEWGFDYSSFSSIISLENIKMKEVDKSPKGWDFINSREDFTFFSALLKYSFLPDNFIQIGYLQSWFQNYNPAAESSQTVPPSILERYKLLEGVSFDWQTKFSSATGLLRILTLKYRYSFLNRGAWLFIKVLYHITPQLYSSVAFDILGAKKKEDYFLNRFLHNDYFSWRLAYDF